MKGSSDIGDSGLRERYTRTETEQRAAEVVHEKLPGSSLIGAARERERSDAEVVHKKLRGSSLMGAERERERSGAQVVHDE